MHAPRWTYVVMLLVLTAYVGALAFPGVVPAFVRDDLLGNLVFVPPLVLLVHKGSERPDQRVWCLTLAVGVTLYLCGNLMYFVHTNLGGPAFPSPADVGYLGIYPFLLAGLLLALREHLRGVRLIVALDGLAGLLAGGAVTCWVIKPLMEHVWDGSLRAATLLAYPIGAVVVMAACCGALGVVGRSRGRHFLLWVLGMLVFGCGDVVYAYRLAYNAYDVGTLLDATWAARRGDAGRRRDPAPARREPTDPRAALVPGHQRRGGRDRAGAGGRPQPGTRTRCRPCWR